MSGRKHKEEEENQERWLLTYADMITLLVAFFMMMYSMSVLNLEKFKAAAMGIRSGFNSPAMGLKHTGDSLLEKGASTQVQPKIELPVEPPPSMRTETRPPQPAPSARRQGVPPQPTRSERVQRLVAELNRSLTGVTRGSAARVTAEKSGVAIELMGDLIFFPTGSAELSAEARNILLAVSGALRPLPNEISVEGYTGHFEAAPSNPFTSSWELSAARAVAVIKFLTEKTNISPGRISLTGYGQYRTRPVGPAAVPRPNMPNDLVRIFIYQD
ncbi:MAG: flagellar motor protein MotB [candidate division FCPU426 bacterium]